jgi:cobalt-zinc-cadmium efflux system protein
VVGAAIGLFILPRAWRLGGDALRVLVQAAPAGTDLDEISAALSAIEGVCGVHDLHVWTLTSDMDVLTAHVAVVEGGDQRAVLHRARIVLAEQFHLSHATLQVESADDHTCDEMTW